MRDRRLWIVMSCGVRGGEVCLSGAREGGEGARPRAEARPRGCVTREATGVDVPRTERLKDSLEP